MKYHIFRNYTIEPLFKNFKNVSYSGYNDINDFTETSDAYIWFYFMPLNQSGTLIRLELESYLEKLTIVLNRIPKEKNVIALTIEELNPFQFVNADFQEKQAIYNYNTLLFEKTKSHPNLKILDFKNFLQSYSIEQLIDWKYYYLTETILNPKLSEPFYSWFNHKIDSLKSIRKKCLILDLDNTLWGGVLGEDGINGVKIGGSYPGNAFKEFQINIKEAAKNGVILAVCSKNNEADVLEFIDKQHEQILKIEDFSVVRINWQEKVKNIKSIADELNIGTDSIVFIDDNPVEQEFVKKTFPEIIVPEFPKMPYKLNSFFKNIYETYFQIYNLTDEDKNKNLQYRSNTQRLISKNENISIENYIASLNTEITVYKVNDFNISRIAQMTQKTNQFNLTTNRYEIGDIKKFIDLGYLIFCASIKDKFGDNGITALIIIKLDADNKMAYIDSLLLSCRVLGREIEKCFLQFALNTLLDLNVETVNAKFVKTEKNIQVEDFYEKNSFTLILKSEETKEYTLQLQKKYILNNYFRINIGYD